MKNWGTRDWFWLVGILIGTNILVVTLRLNDNDDVVNIISLLASASSITLAILAIWQSSTYNSQSSGVFNSLTEKLSILGQNIDDIKENVVKEANDAIDNSQIPEVEKANLKTNIENAIIDSKSMKLIYITIRFQFMNGLTESDITTIKSKAIENIMKTIKMFYYTSVMLNEDKLVKLRLRSKPIGIDVEDVEAIANEMVLRAIGDKKELVKYELKISKTRNLCTRTLK